MQQEQIALLKEIRDLMRQLVEHAKLQIPSLDAPTGGGGPGEEP